ncbi:hypothetical protein [Hoylesella timonensis]|uniref:hypothetical protein n=1 Tax=Hoylesella timonensis TaxID=386414 RepID=UPI00242CBE86|nr:hypothetical protein [Hoylesella timonensis]
MIDVKIIKKPKNKAATPTLRTPGAAYGDKSVKETVHASKADTAKMAEKAIIAEQAEHAKKADEATRADEVSLESKTLSHFLRNDIPNTAAEVVTFLKGVISKTVSFFQGIVNKGDITNSGTITTKNLNVTGKATFFELMIQITKAAGGMTIYSPGAFHIDAVVDAGNYYACYQRAEQDGVKLMQMCKVDDQLMCARFNVGGNGNKFYWMRVSYASPSTVQHVVDGNLVDCLEVRLDKSVKSDNCQGVPEIGDALAVFGNRTKEDRQSVIVISAYNSFDINLRAPYIAQYENVNDFDLRNKKTTWLAKGENHLTGSFTVVSGGKKVSLDDFVTKISQATFKVEADKITARIDVIEKTQKTTVEKFAQLETTVDSITSTVARKSDLEEVRTEIKQTAESISLKVENGARPNLLWGSDLDLSEVQDVINRAYAQCDIIKKKTEAKAEWKRKRDNASSDDDRMRYQDGMDVCDLEIAQAQGELAKRREAIGKHLGIVISGDMEIGKKEMFQYLKGEGVGGADAIRFKNVYKREDWAKWTNISWWDVPLKPNTTYTISVWVKFKSYGKKGHMYVDCNSDDGRYCFGGYLYKEHYYSRESIDEWQRVRYVFNSGASKKMSVLNFCCIADEEEGAQCEIWLCRPKLEEGNTATPWCAYDGTVDALLAGGFDIKEKKFTATADNFVVQNNKGEQTFFVDENGRINNGLLNTLWFYRSFTEINDSNFREYMTYVNGVFRPEIRGSYAFYWVNVAKTGPSITFNITSKSRHENTNFYPAPRIYLNYLSYMPKRNMVPGVLDNILLLGSEMVIVNKGDIAVSVVGSLCFSGYGFPSLAYHGNGYNGDEQEERRHYYQPLMISIDKGEIAHLRCRLIGDRTNVKIGWEYAVGKVSRWNDAISYHPYYQPSNLTDMADGNYPVNSHGEEFTE